MAATPVRSRSQTERDDLVLIFGKPSNQALLLTFLLHIENVRVLDCFDDRLNLDVLEVAGRIERVHALHRFHQSHPLFDVLLGEQGACRETRF